MSMGKPLPHDAAPQHVSGQARYIDDLPFPANALHLAFGLSTVAHGEITGIDLAAADGIDVAVAEDVCDCRPCADAGADDMLDRQ